MVYYKYRSEGRFCVSMIIEMNERRKDMRKKKFLCMLSLILSVVLLLGIVPIYAEPIDPVVSPSEQETNINDPVISEEIELPEIREEKIEENLQTAATANARSSSSTYSYQTLTKIPNGVYALQNVGNAGLWMDIEGDSTTPGMHMQQFAYNTSPADGSALTGLYRITQYGNTDRYIIRAMICETLSFEIVGNEVLTKTIPANDANVTNADTFYITYDTSGYTIRPYGSSQYIGANDTDASGWAGRPDSYLIPQSLSTNFYQNLWCLQSQTIEFEAGVYSFKNQGNDGLWMDTEGDSYGEGAHIQQYAYGSSPCGSFSRGGMFKIAPYGDTGYYVIRLMTNNYLSFTVDGDEVLTHRIPIFDDDVPRVETFSIQFYNGGYVIRPYESSYCISAKNTTASGYEGRPDSYLTPRTLEDAGSRACWTLERYCDVNKAHCQPSGIGYWTAGGYAEIYSLYMWATRQDVSYVRLYIDDAYANIATYDWNSTDHILTAYFHDEGTLPVGISYSGQTANNIYLSSVNFTISLPIEEGEYFFQNKQMEYYMQVDAMDAENGYDTSGAALEIMLLDGGDYQKFTLEHVIDGYYKIITTCGKVLSIHEDYVNDTRHIWQAFYLGEDYQHWKFTKTNRGTYVIRLQASEPYNIDWCMGVPEGSLLCDSVQQQQYVNDLIYVDEWNLIPPDEFSFVLCGIPDTGHDHSSALTFSKSMLCQCEYNNIQLYSNEMTAATYKSYLNTANVIVSRSHGAQLHDANGNANGSCILLTEENSSTRSWFCSRIVSSSDDVECIESNDSFANVKLVIFIGCYTGTGGETFSNLVSQMEAYGATTAIGFDDEIDCGDANTWTRLFLASLATGATVDAAATDASAEMPESSPLSDAVICGDKNYVLGN